MAKRKKAQLDEVLSEVQESLENSPREAIKSHKSGQAKSKYEDHLKFSKFKNKEGN